MGGADSFSIGTIGGPETFAGQSTATLRARHAWMGEPVYYPTGDALFAALGRGEIDGAVGAGANLGDGPTLMAGLLARPESKLLLVAEAALPFGCLLLGGPGARLDEVELVYGGHASLAQARAFLARALPNAETATYADPMATGREVAAAGGRSAVLGTRGLADKFGLSVLAEDVDGGRVNGLWWVIARRPRFEPGPERVYVSLRAGDDGRLGALAAAAAGAGALLSSAWPLPTGAALGQYDYLLRFRGKTDLDACRAALAGFDGARLVGALGAE